ncbi:MAG: S8 family serine peptidase [Patescibacteria group bacterium]
MKHTVMVLFRRYKPLVIIFVLLFGAVGAYLLFYSSASIRQPEPNIVDGSPTFAANELLLKVTPKAKGLIKTDRKPDDTGIAGFNNLNRNNKASKVEQLAVSGKKSKADADIFRWYKITFEPAENTTDKVVKQDNAEAFGRLKRLQGLYQTADFVENTELNRQVEVFAVPNDPYYGSSGSWGQSFQDLWGLHTINAAVAWDSTTGSASVIVADIDTGVDRTHPDIATNMWTNQEETPGNAVDDDTNGYVDDYYGWDWFNSDNDPMDDHGHGTHTVGTIAATGNNNAGVVGVNWTSKIMALKFLSAGGSGTDSGGIQALVYAADNGAKVSSNSWGGAGSSAALDDAIAYEHDRGMVIIAAAGNNNGDALDFTPSSADQAITVAASSPTDTKASFSNWGDKVDVAAPGVSTLSLKAATSPMCSGASVVGGSYCLASGTSMATPHVAGLAALLLAKNPALTNEQLRQIIRTQANDLGAAGKDRDFGYGRINAANAMSAAMTPPLTPIITSPRSRALLTGQAVAITGSANGPNFANYKVEIGAGRAPASWTTLTTATAPVTNAALATLNTTTFSDGTYIIRVTATDTNGKTYQFQVHDVLIDNFDSAISTPFEIVSSGNIQIKGSANAKNGLTLASYKLEWGSGTNPTNWSNSGISLANNGIQAVANGALGTWDTSALVPDQTYSLRLTIDATNGSSDRTVNLVKVDKDLVAGWPKAITGGECTAVYSYCGLAPVLADLDGNGTKEIIITEGTNRISAFNRDGSNVPGFPATVPRSGSATFFYDSPVIADLDGDGRQEIVASTVNSESALVRTIHIIRSDGTPYPNWPRPKFSWRYTDQTPALADLDGDGLKEIILVSPNTGNTERLDGHELHAWRLNGTELTGFPKALTLQSDYVPTATTNRGASRVTVRDFDGDAQPEIAYNYFDRMYLFNKSGEVLPGWPVSIPADPSGIKMGILGTLGTGDVNGDGQIEVVGVAEALQLCGGCGQKLYGWQKSGGLLPGWPFIVTASGSYMNGPSLADIDADNKDEVVVSWDAFDETGKKWTSVASNRLAPAIGNLDIDNEPESVSVNGRNLSIVNNDGSIGWQRQLDRSDSLFTPAVVADINANNRSELAATAAYQQLSGSLGPNDTLVYLWELSGSGAEWPMFQHDAARTGHVSPPAPLPPDTEPPSSPAGVTAAALSPSEVRLNWAASSDNRGVAGYYVIRSMNGGPYLTIAQLGPATTYIDGSVLAATGYQYQIVAYDAADNVSAPATSNPVTTPAPPDTTPPAAPTGLTANPSSSSQIDLTWNAAQDNQGGSGAVSYDVYRNNVKVANISTTSFGDTGLSPNTAYSYFVRAIDAVGNVSTPSSTVTATTQSQATTGIISGVVSGGGQPLSGAKVTVTIGKTKKTYTTASNGSYIITGLNPGSYNLTYAATGYGSQTLSVSVTAGGTTTKNVTLLKKGR